MIETSRLILRRIEKSDADRLYEMYRNPAVMKYIYDCSTFTKERTMQRIDECIAHWEKYGFGFFVVIERSTQLFAGSCVLRYFVNQHPDLDGEIETGYIFDEPFWGKGYATEAVRACIELGFKKHHFKKILATILPENIASQNVVKKAGMIYTGDLDVKNFVHQIYEITR